MKPVMGFAWRIIMGRPRLAIGLVCGLLSLSLPGPSAHR